MNETAFVDDAFQLARRYEEYRLIKSWGIMAIVMAISIGLYLSLDLVIHRIIPIIIAPREELFYFGILGPIFLFTLVCVIITPFILAIATFLSTKRMSLDEIEISSKRYALFGLTLFLFYFIDYWLQHFIAPLIWFLIFPKSVISEDGGIAIYHDSALQESGIQLLFGGLACVVSYLLLTRIIKDRKFKELLVSAVILTGLFFILTFLHYLGISLAPDQWHQRITYPSNTPPFDIIEELASVISGVIRLLCYLISGVYSLKKASEILEGDE